MKSGTSKTQEELALAIKRLREQQGLTIEELAWRVGITPQYLAMIESGKRDLSVSVLCAIAEAMDLRFWDMLSTRDAKLSRKAMELARMYGQTPNPLKEALPIFLRICLEDGRAKASNG